MRRRRSDHRIAEPRADTVGVLAAHTSPRRPLTPSADVSGIRTTPAFRPSSTSLGLTVRVASRTTQRRGLRFRRDDPHRISPRPVSVQLWDSVRAAMREAVGETTLNLKDLRRGSSRRSQLAQLT